MPVFRLTATLALGLLALALVGCSSSNTPTTPLAPFEPEIINTADNFQFQATGLTRTTTTVSYPWENSATQATINHSSVVNQGTTLLSLFDADSTLVYSDSLQASASHQTAVGTAGTWTVQVTLTVVNGTLNFRAESL